MEIDSSSTPPRTWKGPSSSQHHLALANRNRSCKRESSTRWPARFFVPARWAQSRLPVVENFLILGIGIARVPKHPPSSVNHLCVVSVEHGPPICFVKKMANCTIVDRQNPGGPARNRCWVDLDLDRELARRSRRITRSLLDPSIAEESKHLRPHEGHGIRRVLPSRLGVWISHTTPSGWRFSDSDHEDGRDERSEQVGRSRVDPGPPLRSILRESIRARSPVPRLRYSGSC